MQQPYFTRSVTPSGLDGHIRGDGPGIVRFINDGDEKTVVRCQNSVRRQVDSARISDGHWYDPPVPPKVKRFDAISERMNVVTARRGLEKSIGGCGAGDMIPGVKIEAGGLMCCPPVHVIEAPER